MSQKNHDEVATEVNPTYSNFKKDLLRQGYLRSPLKKSPIMNLRDFLIFSTSLLDDYLLETKKKSSSPNLMAFLPYYLEKKFKFSTNNKSQITDFITNFTGSLENFSSTSKEVALFNIFLLEENVSQKKLAFYQKARKSIITYLYYFKIEPGDLDNIELNLNQWSTLTNRMFNEFRNFDEILKNITNRIKSINEKTPAIQKKNCVNASNLLEIWLEFYEKYKKFCSSPPKSNSAKKEPISPEKQLVEKQEDSENSSKNNRKTKKIDDPMIKSFFCPPDSYYKEMIECEDVDKDHVKDRDEKFLKNYLLKQEENSPNYMGKSMIGLMEGDGEKIGEFLKQDSNKFKVLNIILRMIVECEGLLQEFSEVIAYFKHLKDYKKLTEKIKTYQLPNFEEPIISKKINFCKKFIQEYITSLELMTFSKASISEFPQMDKSLDMFNQTPQKKFSNSPSDVPNVPNFNKEEALNEMISDYLNTLHDKVIGELFNRVKTQKQIDDEHNEFMNQIPAKDVKHSIKKGEDSPPQQRRGSKHFTIKINDHTESVIDLKESQEKLVEEKKKKQSKEDMEIEKLKLGDDLTEKINKMIFKEIKLDDIRFLERKLSQEFTNKRHSVHYKKVSPKVTTIAIITKSDVQTTDQTKDIGKGRRSSSIEGFSSHKRSNESTGMSKFNKLSAKKISSNE